MYIGEGSDLGQGEIGSSVRPCVRTAKGFGIVVRIDHATATTRQVHAIDIKRARGADRRRSLERFNPFDADGTRASKPTRYQFALN